MRLAGPLLALLAAAGAGPVFADLTEAERGVLPRLLSAVQADLIAASTGDELVLLLASEDPDAYAADLLVLGGPLGDGGRPLVVARGIAYAGPMAGQLPRLEIADNGSLLVKSEQIAVSRSPWELTLTLAERQDQLRVSGLTFVTWDRLTSATTGCDWNLLSGAWEMSYDRPALPDEGIAAQAGHTSGNHPRHALAAEWTDAGETVPDFCRHDFGD